MKTERTVTISVDDKEADAKMPLYFMDFIREAERVIKLRKKKKIIYWRRVK